MTPDDLLWAILATGILTSIAYVGSELRSHRTRQAHEHERLAQQRLLWLPQQRPAADPLDPSTRKTRLATKARAANAAQGLAVQPCSK
jgi:hypothetical protein